MIRSGVIWILCIAVNLSSAAYACSCRPDTTLEQQYERADHVLIAKITRCRQDRLTSSGSCRSHGWEFDTVENLKGSNAVVRQLPSDAGPSVSSCDQLMQIGQTYLLFLRDGRTYQCSGTRPLGEDARSSPEIEILRAYRNGEITRVENPWHFIDNGFACSIQHRMDVASLQFTYQYAAPPTAYQHAGTLGKPAVHMTVVPMQPFTFVGPTRVEFDGNAMPLQRHLVEMPRVPAFAVDMAHGNAAVLLLDKMSRTEEIVFVGERAVPHEDPEPFRKVLQSRQIPEAAARFKACVASHAEPLG